MNGEVEIEQKVAVKRLTMSINDLTIEDMRNIQHEIELMRELKHENVVCLLGVSISPDNELCLITVIFFTFLLLSFLLKNGIIELKIMKKGIIGTWKFN